jgi:tRNA (guanine37-N1)-methyltransferase
MQFTIITLFHEIFAILNYGVIGRAIKDKKLLVKCINPRDFTQNRHKTVDDRPYGGGPGMLMMAPPLAKAIASSRLKYTKNEALSKKECVIYLSPQGKKLDRHLIECLSKKDHIILVAGRYEGIDQRLIERDIDFEVSLGDFVLSGGEIAALALIDAVTRKIKGVLGQSQSALEDSFEDGLLDHPHYTRPNTFDGQSVPNELMSGNHEKIKTWRLKQRLGQTWKKRPDLLTKKLLTEHEKILLTEFKQEYLHTKK